jgi:hypothetical protein
VYSPNSVVRFCSSIFLSGTTFVDNLNVCRGLAPDHNGNLADDPDVIRKVINNHVLTVSTFEVIAEAQVLKELCYIRDGIYEMNGLSRADIDNYFFLFTLL